MRLTSSQSNDQAVPHQLMEPDLAVWAEKIAIGSATDKRGLWYGALLFWIVVACIIAARIAFLDPGRISQSTAQSAMHSTLTGASSVSHDTKL